MPFFMSFQLNVLLKCFATFITLNDDTTLLPCWTQVLLAVGSKLFLMQALQVLLDDLVIKDKILGTQATTVEDWLDDLHPRIAIQLLVLLHSHFAMGHEVLLQSRQAYSLITLTAKDFY